MLVGGVERVHRRTELARKVHMRVERALHAAHGRPYRRAHCRAREERDEAPARASQSNELVVLLLALGALSGCYPCYRLARMLYRVIDRSCGAVCLSAPAPRLQVPKESRLDGKVSCASGTLKPASSQPACFDRSSSEDVSECFSFCLLGSQTHRALLCAACSISVGNGGNRVT